MYRDDREAQFARLVAVMCENDELRAEVAELRRWPDSTRSEIVLAVAVTGPVVLGTLYCLAMLL